MERQLGLLSGPEFSEVELEAKVSPLYPSLWRMIREPSDDLFHRRSQDSAFRLLDEGESAQWLRPQIVAKAHDLFDDRADVHMEKVRGQWRLIYNNELAITPKKFKKRWLRQGFTFSSYDTSQNKDYWQQRIMEGFDSLPRVIVGYQFVQEMTDIRIFVAYPAGKNLKFFFLMPDQGDVVASYVPPVMDDTEDQGKDYRVKTKRNAGAGKKA